MLEGFLPKPCLVPPSKTRCHGNQATQRLAPLQHYPSYPFPLAMHPNHSPSDWLDHVPTRSFSRRKCGSGCREQKHKHVVILLDCAGILTNQIHQGPDHRRTKDEDNNKNRRMWSYAAVFLTPTAMMIANSINAVLKFPKCMRPSIDLQFPCFFSDVPYLVHSSSDSSSATCRCSS